MKKSKIISLCTAAILAVTLSGQVLALSTPFTDIANSSAKDKITALQEKGFVKGIGNDLFAPEKTITAAESIQLIVNALDLNIDTIRFIKEPKASDYFKKADDNAWYASAFIIAPLNGLELPNDLDPSATWTKQEFTYQLITAMELKANLPMIKLIPVKITDEASLEASYSGAIQRALLYKVVSLDAAGNFNPTEKLTRANAAEQIYNALEYLKAHRPAPVVE